MGPKEEARKKVSGDMELVLCVDNRGGMCFHQRRQSQDRAVRADLLQMARGRVLRMSEYSRRQFTEPDAVIDASPDFLERAAEGDVCFVEQPPISPWLDRAAALVLYRWNRVYPSDQRLDIVPEQVGFHLQEQLEFPGYSHKTITKEVYIK